MADAVFLVFEIVGTVSFAISGAITGIKKNMDIFGVIILGIITAVGGGAVRDIVLGAAPPAMFQNPAYTVLATVISVIAFFPSVRNFFGKKHHMFEQINLLMDSLGLGVFTVVGVRTAYRTVDSENIFLIVFVGIITGVGGGIMRDILAGQTPYIFVKHFYACASIIGAAVAVSLWKYAGEPAAMLTGAAAVVILRLLAARYRWSLPKPDFKENKNG